MQGMYSMRSPAVKRLMKEAQELSEATEQYYCQPLEDNLFEWHFTIRGPSDTEFEGGLYHGRIVLPPDYPMKPPSIILLTHNGRFETNKKICLSISGHHPESWQPSWSIRTALLAIIGFMPTHGAGALGSLDYSQDERRLLARRSVEYKCHECGPILHTLKPVTEESRKTIEEAKQLASQMDFKNEKEKNAALKDAPKEPPVSTDTGITDLPTEGAQSPPNTGAIPKVQTAPPPFPQPMPIGETALPPFPQPMPFGQFPMQMPFMPPFPMQANASQNQQENRILNQVPRFPLPFAAPMSPPFLPLVPPMVPGMNFPPNFPSNITTGTPLINDSASGDRQQTSTPSPNLSAQSSTNSVSTTNSPSPQTNEPSQPVTVSSTSTSEAESTSAQEASSSSTSDGPRQRNITRTEAAESSPRVRVSYPAHPAPSVTRPSQSESSPMFIAFAVIVISLIALLLLRRLYMMKYLAGLF